MVNTEVLVGSRYDDAGAYAYDDVDGDISALVLYYGARLAVVTKPARLPAVVAAHLTRCHILSCCASCSPAIFMLPGKSRAVQA